MPPRRVSIKTSSYPQRVESFGKSGDDGAPSPTDPTPPLIAIVAGFDGFSASGLLADLKTVSALGGYGVCAVTALPIQSSTGCQTLFDLPQGALEAQLSALPSGLSAVKIGMVKGLENLKVLLPWLKALPPLPVVLDPVLETSSGFSLLDPGAYELFISDLVPHATVLTPNLPEAYALLGKKPSQTPSPQERETLAQALLALGPKAVLLKGGHGPISSFVEDFFLPSQGTGRWIQKPRLSTPNTRGTGCTLSSALATLLAQGLELEKAILIAEEYVSKALLAAQNWTLAEGSGPVDHFFHLRPSCLE